MHTGDEILRCSHPSDRPTRRHIDRRSSISRIELVEAKKKLRDHWPAVQRLVLPCEQVHNRAVFPRPPATISDNVHESRDCHRLAHPTVTEIPHWIVRNRLAQWTFPFPRRNSFSCQSVYLWERARDDHGRERRKSGLITHSRLLDIEGWESGEALEGDWINTRSPWPRLQEDGQLQKKQIGIFVDEELIVDCEETHTEKIRGNSFK